MVEIEIVRVTRENGEYVGTEIYLGKTAYFVDESEKVLRVGSLTPDIGEKFWRTIQTYTCTT